MTIFLHPDTKNELTNTFREAFLHATEIFSLSAYLREWEDFNLSKECKAAILVVGKDFGITRKIALSKALEWKKKNNRIAHVYVADKIDGYHPKILLWAQMIDDKKKWFLIVGSSNLTLAGFASNYEANIKVEITEVNYRTITKWIASILALSCPVTKAWIDAYQEAKNLPKVKAPTVPSKITGLQLPEYPGLAIALAQRRETFYEFDAVVRQNLINAINDCAQGVKKDKEFYEWLITNWNGSAWKYQGSGVFRRQWDDTNWTALCVGLVEILNSTPANRDVIVQRVYDRLEDAGDVAARKAVLTEMLCHFFPDAYPLWNTPIEKWLKHKEKWPKQRGLTKGTRYIHLAKILREALKANPDYPARNLGELDHVIWGYCHSVGLVG
ncbi:phospholipase D family protein [Methylobacter sp. G7]|uniref:phospholipase D family protein n=1 Tax=Methylobacter sp. G7 TaxID=3230117 RepID=UPI003D80456D